MVKRGRDEPDVSKPFCTTWDHLCTAEDDAQRIRTLMSCIIKAPIERVQDRRNKTLFVNRVTTITFETSYSIVYHALLRRHGHVWDRVRREQLPYLALEYARSNDQSSYNLKLDILRDISLFAENTWVRVNRSEGTISMGRRLWASCYSNPKWRACHLLWGLLVARKLRFKLMAVAHFTQRYNEIAYRPNGSGYLDAARSFAAGCVTQNSVVGTQILR